MLIFWQGKLQFLLWCFFPLGFKIWTPRWMWGNYFKSIDIHTHTHTHMRRNMRKKEKTSKYLSVNFPCVCGSQWRVCRASWLVFLRAFEEMWAVHDRRSRLLNTSCAKPYTSYTTRLIWAMFSKWCPGCVDTWRDVVYPCSVLHKEPTGLLNWILDYCWKWP